VPNTWENAPETLPFFGLYNASESTGFFSELVDDMFLNASAMTGDGIEDMLYSVISAGLVS